MGIKVRAFKDGSYLLWDGYNCEALNWEHLFLDEEKVKDYLELHPFPKDKEYSEENLFMDIRATGSITLRCEREETAEYIAGMIYKLI